MAISRERQGAGRSGGPDEGHRHLWRNVKGVDENLLTRLEPGGEID